MTNKDTIKDISVDLSIVYEKNYEEKVASRIRNAELPSLLLDDLPIVISKRSTLNIISGDTGIGKTILNQSIIRSVLERDTEKKYFILWFDLQFQAGVAKQRGVDKLMEEYLDDFRLIHYKERIAEEFYKETGREWTNARMVFYLTNGFYLQHPGKHLLVFVDSLEDFIEDTSSNEEAKNILLQLLSLDNVSFIFSHYAEKKNRLLQSYASRKLTIFKNKADSIIYIDKRTDPDEETIEYTLDIIKINASWHGDKNILITVEKPALRIKSINLNLNSLVI